jgi:hypothetical protein
MSKSTEHGRSAFESFQSLAVASNSRGDLAESSASSVREARCNKQGNKVYVQSGVSALSTFAEYRASAASDACTSSDGDEVVSSLTKVHSRLDTATDYRTTPVSDISSDGD